LGGVAGGRDDVGGGVGGAKKERIYRMVPGGRRAKRCGEGTGWAKRHIVKKIVRSMERKKRTGKRVRSWVEPVEDSRMPAVRGSNRCELLRLRVERVSKMSKL